MKNSIQKKIKIVATFTCAMMLAITFTASTLSFIVKNYGDNVHNSELVKSEIESKEMQESMFPVPLRASIKPSC